MSKCFSGAGAAFDSQSDDAAASPPVLPPGPLAAASGLALPHGLLVVLVADEPALSAERASVLWPQGLLVSAIGAVSFSVKGGQQVGFLDHAHVFAVFCDDGNTAWCMRNRPDQIGKRCVMGNRFDIWQEGCR